MAAGDGAKGPADVAVALVGLAAALAPELARWLSAAAASSDEPIAARVREILPEASASARAARELEGGG